MIKKIFLKNFKCFEDAVLNIENVSFLIGTNSSGKTNAIEGAMILSELMTGRDIATILDGSKNYGGMIRGGSKGCAHFGSDSFSLGCLVAFDKEIDLKYTIEIIVSDRVYVKAESLYEIKGNKTKPMFSTKLSSEESVDIVVTCNNGLRGKNPDISCIRASSVISQVVTKLSTDTQYGKRIVAYAQAVISSMKEILYLNPQSNLMRNYSAINDITLKVDASNISSVLNDLCEDSDKKNQLLKVMKTLPENEIVNISFAEGPLNDVILFLDEKYGKHVEKVDAMRLSDGTLRCLAMIAALLSEDENGMIVVEEIDNGIHPGRAKMLIREVSRIARERKIDVLITTHNATMLNALTKEDLVGVSVVYREETAGDGQIIPFMDIPDMPLLLANGKLGDVFTNDEILKYIKKEPIPYDYTWLGV